MKRIIFLSVFVLSVSCNVISMLGSNTSVPDDFYAHASATAIPPLFQGDTLYFNETSGDCDSSDYTVKTFLGAGFESGTKLIIYEHITSSNVSTAVNPPIELNVTAFIDQGEITFDLTALPTLQSNESYLFKLENSNGAFSKGNGYKVRCDI